MSILNFLASHIWIFWAPHFHSMVLCHLSLSQLKIFSNITRCNTENCTQALSAISDIICPGLHKICTVYFICSYLFIYLFIYLFNLFNSSIYLIYFYFIFKTLFTFNLYLISLMLFIFIFYLKNLLQMELTIVGYNNIQKKI